MKNNSAASLESRGNLLNITRNEISYYDQRCVWDGYQDNQDEMKRAASTIDLIPMDVESVLDIGCGNGIVTNKINKSLVVGIDFARTPIKNLKTCAIQGSIDSLPIKSRVFDLIIITEVLEHLDEKVYFKAISEINRLGSKYILITVPYNENIEITLCKCAKCGHLFSSSHHRRTFNEDSFHGDFPEYEVETIKYETYYIPPNALLSKLKQKLGIYYYSQLAMCDKCGSRPIESREIYRYIFGGLNRIDRLLKTIFGISRPYHLMILLKRIS